MKRTTQNWLRNHKGRRRHVKCAPVLLCTSSFFGIPKCNHKNTFLHNYFLSGTRGKRSGRARFDETEDHGNFKVNRERTRSHDPPWPGSLRITSGHYCAWSWFRSHDPTWPPSGISIRMVHFYWGRSKLVKSQGDLASLLPTHVVFRWKEIKLNESGSTNKGVN